MTFFPMNKEGPDKEINLNLKLRVRYDIKARVKSETMFSYSGAVSKMEQKKPVEKKYVKRSPDLLQVGQRVIFDMKDGLETVWPCSDCRLEITFWKARGIFFRMRKTNYTAVYQGGINNTQNYIVIDGVWTKNRNHRMRFVNDKIKH